MSAPAAHVSGSGTVLPACSPASGGARLPMPAHLNHQSGKCWLQVAVHYDWVAPQPNHNARKHVVSPQPHRQTCAGQHPTSAGGRQLPGRTSAIAGPAHCAGTPAPVCAGCPTRRARQSSGAAALYTTLESLRGLVYGEQSRMASNGVAVGAPWEGAGARPPAGGTEGGGEGGGAARCSSCLRLSASL